MTGYFSHDMDAASDEKIQALLLDYGAAGYGLYWLIVERLRRAEEHGYALPLKEFIYSALGRMAGLEPSLVQAMIRDCVDRYELFREDGEQFWSVSLQRRMEAVDAKRNQARDAAKARWAKARAKSAPPADSPKADAPEPDPSPQEDPADTPAPAQSRPKKTQQKGGPKKAPESAPAAAERALTFPPGDPRGEVENPPTRLKDPLADQFEVFFWKHTGAPVNFGRERKACANLSRVIRARYPEDPEAFAAALAKRYVEKVRSGEKFWCEQPVSASGLLTHMDRVASMLRDDHEASNGEERAYTRMRERLARKGIAV